VLIVWPGRARIVAPGYAMHVILRGIDRSAVFFADEDRQFLSVPGEYPWSSDRANGHGERGLKNLCPSVRYPREYSLWINKRAASHFPGLHLIAP
jgi:hypothetical protein